MSRPLLVLLVTVLVVEAIVLIGVATALFLLGATETIVGGAGMLLVVGVVGVAGVAGVVTLISVRPRR